MRKISLFLELGYIWVRNWRLFFVLLESHEAELHLTVKKKNAWVANPLSVIVQLQRILVLHRCEGAAAFTMVDDQVAQIYQNSLYQYMYF